MTHKILLLAVLLSLTPLGLISGSVGDRPLGLIWLGLLAGPAHGPFIYQTSFAAPSGLAGVPVQSAGDRGLPVLAIGQVQGNGPASPYDGQVVTVQGVIYDRILTRSDTGTAYHGLFMQSRPGSEDGDPETSDGIYVFLGAEGLIGDYAVSLGDEIVLQGTVGEHSGLTELEAPLVVIEQTGTDVMVPATELMADAAPVSNAAREKWESMRVTVPAGALVVAPTHLYSTYGDSEFFVVRGDSVPAQRGGYTRRVYRDQYAGEQSYLISVEANVLKAAGEDYDAIQLPPANTYDETGAALTGPLYYAFGKFTVEVESVPEIRAGSNPSSNNPPVPADRAAQFTLETRNAGNLYDYLNNPDNGCDFNPDSGCPGVIAPYDYVPANAEDYRAHLQKLARQIVETSHGPDVIAIQEAEAQDLCSGGGQIYGRCAGTGSNEGLYPSLRSLTPLGMISGSVGDRPLLASEWYPDGELDVLQDLVAEIAALGGPTYRTAGDLLGGDYRGIIVAYLYRTDRVGLAPATQDDPLLGSRPDDPDRGAYPHNGAVQNPKALQGTFRRDGGPLFDRLPQVALFRVHRTSVLDHDYVRLYVIGNHFKSGPDENVRLRTEQADYNGGLVAAVKAAGADRGNAYVAVAGDLNVYPDSPQLAGLRAQARNTYDSELFQPAGRYGYIYDGTSQTLDQVFASPALYDRLAAVAAAHVNADYAYIYRRDAQGLYRASDHDPIVVTFSLPPAPAAQIFLPQVGR